MVLRLLNYAKSMDSESNQASEWKDIVLVRAANRWLHVKVTNHAQQRSQAVVLAVIVHALR